MAKYCTACKQIIRRPVDHVHCPGMIDNWFLNDSDKLTKEEITKDFKVPSLVRSSNNITKTYLKVATSDPD